MLGESCAASVGDADPAVYTVYYDRQTDRLHSTAVCVCVCVCVCFRLTKGCVCARI